MTVFPVTHSVLSIKALLSDVLPNYDIKVPTECKFLSLGLNDTFLVTTGQNKYILRAYRKDWRSREDIHFELELLQHLKQQGIPVAAPIARKDGTFVEEVLAPEGLRYIALFSYALGKEIAYEADEENDCYLYGKAVANIHTATATFQSNYRRFSIDLEHLLDKPLESIGPLLAHRPDDWNYLVTLVEKLRTCVQALPLKGLETGVCHGDFHGGNVHVNEHGTYTFFDFDCCGFGWRTYDIAVFRWSSRLANKEKERWTPFLRGYTEVRPLEDIDLRATPYFVAIRHVWLTGLHTGNGQDWGYWMDDRYFDRALKFFREWEAEFLPS
jgi:Ser/Thr protein kinase RdoA (MazF antagonist)